MSERKPTLRKLPEWLDRKKNPAACDLLLAITRTTRLKTEVVEDLMTEAIAEAYAHGYELGAKEAQRATAYAGGDDGVRDWPLTAEHSLLDGYCPTCNGSCLVGFGNDT